MQLLSLPQQDRLPTYAKFCFLSDCIWQLLTFQHLGEAREKLNLEGAAAIMFPTVHLVKSGSERNELLLTCCPSPVLVALFVSALRFLLAGS